MWSLTVLFQVIWPGPLRLVAGGVEDRIDGVGIARLIAAVLPVAERELVLLVEGPVNTERPQVFRVLVVAAAAEAQRTWSVPGISVHVRGESTAKDNIRAGEVATGKTPAAEGLIYSGCNRRRAGNSVAPFMMLKMFS